MMKTIKLIAIMGLLSMLLSCCGSHKADYSMAFHGEGKEPAGKLTRMHYAVSGTMAQPTAFYRLTKVNDNTARLVVATDTLFVDRAVLDRVAELIVKGNVHKLKSHYEPAMEVLDGEGWTFSATYDNEEYINTGGSNAWPDDFGGILGVVHYLDALMKEGADRVIKGDGLTYDLDGD